MACVDEGYAGAVCELRDRQQQLLTTGLVAQIGGDFIKLNNTAELVSGAMKEMPVYLNITHPELGTASVSGKVYLAASSFAIISDIKPVPIGERRSFYRLSLELPSVAQHGAARFPVVVNNISLGGVMFTCKSDIATGVEMTVELALLTRIEPFHCAIKRVTHSKNNTRRYACQFVGNDDKKTELLCQYMFRMEGQRGR